MFYLNVSRIIVNKTNFPSSGTTSEVGGIISANKRKNTVSDSKIEMDKLTWKKNITYNYVYNIITYSVFVDKHVHTYVLLLVVSQ